MDLKLRSTRTLKVTELKLTAAQIVQLADLALDPRYQALLDVMERACIELETAHFNTPVGNPEEVLGGHCVAKSGWLFFGYVQKQVLNAYNRRAGDSEESQPASLDDLLQGVA